MTQLNCIKIQIPKTQFGRITKRNRSGCKSCNMPITQVSHYQIAKSSDTCCKTKQSSWSLLYVSR